MTRQLLPQLPSFPKAAPLDARASLGLALIVGLVALVFAPGFAHGQCTEVGPYHNYNGGGQIVCPCFVQGEQAGVILNVPANEYPIEILKIGIGWASQYGGAPQSLEQAIHIYEGTPPNPGAPTYSLLGPVLNDGAINEFNIEFTAGDKVIESGPFMVTLEFLNSNAGSSFLPTVFHDGNGCQGGKNVVFAIPGGWYDACALGVTGDWVFYIKYRSLKPSATSIPGVVQFSGVPGNQTTCETVYVRNDGCDTLRINGISGCESPPFGADTTMTDHDIPPGDSTAVTVCVTPTTMDPDVATLTLATNNGDEVIGVFLDGLVTGILPGGTPGTSALSVFPNPFNPSTTLRFTLPGPTTATAEIYDVGGMRVRVLARDRAFDAGDNTLDWDGRNDNGEALSSGVYLLRVSSRFGTEVTRAVLLK